MKHLSDKISHLISKEFFVCRNFFTCEELLASSTANQAKFSYRASTDWVSLVWSVVNTHLERGFVLTCEGPPFSRPGAGSAILGQSHLSKQWVVPRTGHGIVDGWPLLKRSPTLYLLQLLLTDYRNLLGYGIIWICGVNFFLLSIDCQFFKC